MRTNAYEYICWKWKLMSMSVIIANENECKWMFVQMHKMAQAFDENKYEWTIVLFKIIRNIHGRKHVY